MRCLKAELTSAGVLGTASGIQGAPGQGAATEQPDPDTHSPEDRDDSGLLPLQELRLEADEDAGELSGGSEEESSGLGA
eukprot:3941222-Rhodomonas_salina.4